ncbi:aspartate kinase [Thomasclavelia cocleata]|uniref:amino acid kinase family protein n=1 Tax=Thomasclavelia cocleata TaxID=69824 RepID=UPI00242B0B95|nr:aspartate kinase [Thomasclavelia cocleata]
MYKVLKFGGTSLRDNDSISAVSRIIKKNSNHKLIVIVSAMGRYPEPYATDTLKELVSWQLSYDEYSRIVSCGETISSVVLSSELRKKNIKAISLSSLQAGLKVRGNRLVDFDKEKVIEYFKKYDVIILPGFQGVDKYKNVRILQQGDSDYSAVYIARRMDLDEVYIYSDVCGIYTGDPKYISDARLIKHVGYRQALDLAKHKARIICYKALLEGYHKDGFKINLRSIYNDSIGTLINHDDTKIKTMSIDFNYWLIRFDEEIVKKDFNYLFDKYENDYLVLEENLHKLKTKYTKIDAYTKVHFVGCELENDDIYRDFLEKFALTSNKEADSYYVKVKMQKQDINLLHDLIVRSD